MKILCWLLKHKRGYTQRVNPYNGNRSIWTIECERCGYRAEYRSPYLARLVGKEMQLGFDGD